MGALKRGREELPHVRARGQRPRVPDCDSAEELPRVRGQGQRPRGVTPHLRSGAAARRRYPTPLSPRPGAAGGRSNPTPQARGGGWEDQPHAVAARAQEGLEELSHVEGQKGGGEEIPFVQGKEHWLRFAGAAVKRYPTPRETQVRW